MNPVQLALANVDIFLPLIHGILLQSEYPKLAEFNLELRKLVAEANAWLDEQDFECTYHEHDQKNTLH